MLSNNQERRRYFRITDQVSITYCVLGGGDTAVTGMNLSTPTTLFIQLENQINASLETLKMVQPQVHELFALFNRKINLAFSLDETLTEPVAEQQKRSQQVNISACGIAFPTNEQLQVNDRILLDMTLFPSNIGLKLVAVVIACDVLHEPVGEDGFIVRADFEGISSSEQEVLVQHVIKRQTQQLKERREARLK